jgi:hypothetical protein
VLGLTSERRGPLARLRDDRWGRRSGFLGRERDGGASQGVLIAGVVVVGLGLLAWAYLGPDLRRYLKIHSM